MGVDPIWFAIMVCLAINVGAITPPVGINLFVLKGLNKEIPLGNIYWGSLPFVVATLLASRLKILSGRRYFIYTL